MPFDFRADDKNTMAFVSNLLVETEMVNDSSIESPEGLKWSGDAPEGMIHFRMHPGFHVILMP